MMLKNKQQLKELFERPVFLASEARKAGIPPSRLSYYVKTGRVERISHGVYRGINSTVDAAFQWEELIVATKSIPNGIVCLVSALAIYEIIDEIPRENWVAVSHATTAPIRRNTRIVRMRDMNTGRATCKLDGETINIFDRERTIVDAFRYLSKEIAINRTFRTKFSVNFH